MSLLNRLLRWSGRRFRDRGARSISTRLDASFGDLLYNKISRKYKQLGLITHDPLFEADRNCHYLQQMTINLVWRVDEPDSPDFDVALL